VLDIRSLKPLDEDAAGVGSENRPVVIVQEAPRTCGFAAELARPRREGDPRPARPGVACHRLRRPYPYWQIEDAYMPSAERVVAAARRH
jgi:pyruvate/2-oxoglutarate/acetoin dehydrogenase E1 component